MADLGIPLNFPGPPPQPAPLNPLDVLQGVARAQNMMNQNRMFQSEYAAREAMGRAFEGAVSPEGKIDYDSALAAMARDPAAAFRLPEVANQIEQRRLTQVQAAKAKAETAQTYLTMTNQAIASLQELGPNVTKKDLVQALGTLTTKLNIAGINEGMGSFLNASKLLKDAPDSGPELAQWVLRARDSNLSAQQQLERHKLDIRTVEGGNFSAVTGTDQYSGQSRLIGTVGKNPTPGEASAIVERQARPGERLPDGTIAQGKETIKTPRAQFAPMVGSGPGGLYSPAPQPGAGPTGGAQTPALPMRAAPTTAAPGGSGTAVDTSAGLPMRAAQTPSTGPQIGSPTGGTRVPAGPAGVVASPSAIQDTALGGEGTHFAKAEEELNNRVGVGQQLMVRIGEMRDLLSKIRAGGGAQAYFGLAKLAQSIPGISPQVVDFFNRGDTGASEEFNKFALQTSTEMLRQMMVGSKMTNTEFEQFYKNNPNLNTDPRAIENIFNFMSRIYKLDVAKQKELRSFVGAGKNPADFDVHWAQKGEEDKFWKAEETHGIYKGAPPPVSGSGGRRTIDDIVEEYRRGRSKPQ